MLSNEIDSLQVFHNNMKKRKSEVNESTYQTSVLTQLRKQQQEEYQLL